MSGGRFLTGGRFLDVFGDSSFHFALLGYMKPVSIQRLLNRF